MATAVFPALPGFLFKGPFSDALAFLQPVIYSGVCSLPRANGTQQRHNAPHTKLPSAFELKLEPNGKVFILKHRHHLHPRAPVQASHGEFHFSLTFDQICGRWL